ncbi:hypothetical protein E0Z10_g8046 [Xylaria hypoxylon]|uniref:Uncharacterized protein n=1 Tax=Xylaria hypoxylon TaxID=37992 RepID=A0A4Z0YA14_9PEZI|nr:hypothetical protein E0Z10_g8046 [Xylaria hypoxylon]
MDSSINVDWDHYEVVTKHFVAQAHQDHIELHDVKKALEEKTEEYDKIMYHWQTATKELSDLKSPKPSLMNIFAASHFTQTNDRAAKNIT